MAPSAGDLNTTDRLILAKLREGRATPGYLADELGKAQSYISQRLAPLVESGDVKKVDRGLYGLSALEGDRVDAADLVADLEVDELIAPNPPGPTSRSGTTDQSQGATTTSESNQSDQFDQDNRGSDTNQSTPTDQNDRDGPGTETAELVEDVRSYLEATDQPPKTAHGRDVVLDVLDLLREHGTLSTGDLQDAIYPDYTDHWGSARTMWNAIDRYLKDVPGIEKPGYGEWTYAGDENTRAEITENTPVGSGGVYDPTEEF